MAATHKTVKQSGGADYTTISAALAASSSGTGPSDRSTVTILDSATYSEAVSFGTLNYIDLTVEAGCAPTITSTATTFAASAGANYIRVIGDPAAPGLLLLNPGGGTSGSAFSLAPGVSLTVQDFNFGSSTGTANVFANGTTGTAWTFTRCDCTGGNWSSPVRGSGVGTITLTECDWTAMVNQTGPVVTTNSARLIVSKCRLKGSTLLGSFTTLGTASGVHSVTNTILVQTVHTTYTAMIDFRPSAGHSVGASVWDCTLIGEGTAGKIGFRTEYGNESVRNLIVKGFASQGWYSLTAWQPSYSCTYGCGTVYGGSASAGAGMIESDPLLDGDYRPAWGSPCIGTGTLTGLTEDIEGNPRPYNATEDMGAFEFARDVTIYTGTARTGEPAYVYATDLTGAPLPGFDPFDLTPAVPGDPLVTLAQLVLVSLLSDREALVSDRIPDGTDDRRGWWADAYEEDGAKVGSRLWLLMGQPVRNTTPDDAKAYGEEALAWMTRDGLAAGVVVDAETQGTAQERRIAVGINVTRGDGTGVRIRFPDLWAALGG
jgi:phage gp46-like protein